MLKIATLILDLLFPKRCAVCDTVIEKSELLCTKCKSKKLALDDKVCLKCGRKMEGSKRDGMTEYCTSCKKKHYAFKQGKICFEYADEMKTSVQRFKYGNRREYAEFYAATAKERYGKWLKRCGVDLIVPVPMYKWKKWYRGYNQAELFGKALGREMDIPVQNAVERVKNTRPQAGLGDEERKNNLQNAFKTGTKVVKYKKVLIVDDIYTTGNTVNEIAKALLGDGAYEVYVLCVAAGADLGL